LKTLIFNEKRISSNINEFSFNTDELLKDLYEKLSGENEISDIKLNRKKNISKN